MSQRDSSDSVFLFSLFLLQVLAMKCGNSPTFTHTQKGSKCVEINMKSPLCVEDEVVIDIWVY